MKLLIRTLVSALAALVASNAPAATVVCEGTVEQVAFHANGNLMLRLSSMNTPVFFCSPDADWNVAGAGNVTAPGSCKAMYATFLAARLSRTPIAGIYFDGDAVPASCTSWPGWTRANIRYFVM
jgi:hypothetical protein